MQTAEETTRIAEGTQGNLLRLYSGAAIVQALRLKAVCTNEMPWPNGTRGPVHS